MTDKSPDDFIVSGKIPLARHFGVSLRTVQRWARERDFPKLSGGRFDIHQVQAWRDLRQGRPPAPGVVQSSPEGKGPVQGFLTPQRGRDFQDERLKKGKADLVEMEVRQRRGELVEWGQVEAMFVARVMAVKQGLLSLARALPPQLIRCREEREMEAIIGRVVRELLEAYSRPLPRPAATGPGAPAAVAPSKMAESGR